MLSERSFTLATSNDQTLFIIGFSHTAGLDIQASTKIFPTMKAGHDTMPSVLIMDGTRVKGYGNENDPMFTIDTVGGHGVAIIYSFDALSSNSMKSSNPNSGCREVEISKTIDTMALNPSANQGGIAVASETTVRRLTPVECERLQGFPDNWTAERFDEKKQAVVAQADTARYKQMGNAVAVPVVDWLVSRLVEHA